MRLLLVSIFLTISATFSLNAQTTTGFASTYPTAYEGLPTASGEVFNSQEYTARHATLPFNTLVKVTNLKNNKTVTVRINDRFNYKNNRVIDISQAAAKTIELFGEINPQVKIEVIGMADAIMLASLPKTNTTETNKTTPAKPVVAQETKRTTPAKTTTDTENTEVDTEAPKPTAPILSGIKVKIPSIDISELSNLATVTFDLITISLFK